MDYPENEIYIDSVCMCFDVFNYYLNLLIYEVLTSHCCCLFIYFLAAYSFLSLSLINSNKPNQILFWFASRLSSI